MTRTIDLNELQALAGIQIQLASVVKAHQDPVEVEAVAGFDGVAAVQLVATVHSFLGDPDASLTVTVEQSADGDSWSTVNDFEFTALGSELFTAETPSDQLRVVVTPVGVVSHAAASVVAVPNSVVPAA